MDVSLNNDGESNIEDSEAEAENSPGKRNVKVIQSFTSEIISLKFYFPRFWRLLL